MKLKIIIVAIYLVWGFSIKAQLVQYQILPSATDVNINTFTNTDQKHIVFLNNSVSKKNKLFIFLPGTGGNPSNIQRIDSLAANLGYHSIGLMYPNEPAIGSLCASNSDIDCYTKTRMEVIDGTDRTTLITVDRANSIENRIIKLLHYLQLQNPAENWSQFLDNSNNIIWEKVVIAGHSQGGGHAGMIAKNHKVARVLMFGAPKDFHSYYSQPANWINSHNQTPANRYFVFTHSSDDFGCSFNQQIDMFTLFGLNQYGAMVNVDNIQPPYNTRILTSTISVTTAFNAHSCVISDNVVKLDNNNIPIYRPVWLYMLNSEIPTEIFDTKEKDNILIYPNPATNLLTIKNAKANSIVTIYDLTGKQLINCKLQNEQINISELPNGFYTIKINSDNLETVTKFIKQ